MYSTHIVPKDKCLGIITPLHKEGPQDDPDNYRGICISSTLNFVNINMFDKYAVSSTYGYLLKIVQNT